MALWDVTCGTGSQISRAFWIPKRQAPKARLIDSLVNGTLDEPTYKEQAEKIDAEIAVKRMELNDSEIEDFDVEALLSFAGAVDIPGRKTSEEN